MVIATAMWTGALRAPVAKARLGGGPLQAQKERRTKRTGVVRAYPRSGPCQAARRLVVVRVGGVGRSGRPAPPSTKPPGATDPHLDRRRARRPSREVRPKSPLFCCVVRASLGAAPRRARCHSAVQSPRRCRPLSGARGVRAVDRPQSAAMPFHSPNDERPPRRTSCWCGRRPSRTRRCP